VLWHCWLVGRKCIRPVKKEWWGAGMVIALERGADLHMAQLMPLPLTVCCFSKIQIGFTFLVPAHLGSPGKRAVKWVCVCVCVRACVRLTHTGGIQWIDCWCVPLFLASYSFQATSRVFLLRCSHHHNSLNTDSTGVDTMCFSWCNSFDKDIKELKEKFLRGKCPNLVSLNLYSAPVWE